MGLAILAAMAGCGGSSGTAGDGGSGGGDGATDTRGAGGTMDARGAGGATDAGGGSGGRAGTGGITAAGTGGGGLDAGMDGSAVAGTGGTVVVGTGGTIAVGTGGTPAGTGGTAVSGTGGGVAGADAGADAAPSPDAGVGDAAAADAGVDMGPVEECTPGWFRCVDATSQQCGPNGLWNGDMLCPFGCNATLGMCNGCTDEPLTTTCTAGRCGPVTNNCGRTVTCVASCNKALGASCQVAAECASGFCVDGACCNTACGGACEACNVTGQVGTCAPIAAGQDPANECPTDDVAGCGRTGACDGNRACAFYAAGTQCAAATCTGAQRTLAGRCDGAGVCVSGSVQSCAPFVCGAAGECLGTCARDADCVGSNSCIGGTCGKKPNGGTCAEGDECLSAICAQGICCATTCTGTCLSCALPGSTGACTPVPSGQDPLEQCAASAPATCGNDGMCDGAGGCRRYAAGTQCVAPVCNGTTLTTQRTCDGIGTCQGATDVSCVPYLCGTGACKTSCAADGECTSGNYCSAAATCVAKKDTGVGCLAGNECTSGFCVDGVCCNTACAGTCQACSASRTGGPDGTCRAVTVGTDPDNECPDSAASTCGTDGTCDGAGACRRWAAGTICAPESCAGSTDTPARTCDGAGACRTVTSAPCSPFVCGSGGCKTSCTSAATDCEPGNYCASGSCLPIKSVGAPCGAGFECGTGACVDGVCCESACAGTCQACNSARTGAANGLCRPVAAGTDPDSECPDSAASTCGTDGTCDGAGACRLWAAGTVCATGTCAAASATATSARVCNGLGTCQAATTASCLPYACGATTCNTQCASDGDCTAPAICGAGGRPGRCGVPATLAGPTSFGFGGITVGTSSDPLNPEVWTITNTGDFATGTLGTSKSTGEIGVAADTCAGAILLPAQSCALSLTFTPAAAGARGGTVTVTATTGETITITVTATGVDGPPVWHGGPQVAMVGSPATSLSVSWTAATDDVSPAASIRYLLCWTTGAGSCAGNQFTTMATVTGMTSTTITGLPTRTAYTVWVRAQDAAGNTEAGDHAASATTATSYATDVVPRTFGGVCSQCHAWTRANTVNVSSSQTVDLGPSCGGVVNKYIVPGSPQTSYLFNKMNANGTTTAPFSADCPSNHLGQQMPYFGPYEPTTIAVMGDWITQGALDN